MAGASTLEQIWPPVPKFHSDLYCLNSFDLIILIDSSASMARVDCPSCAPGENASDSQLLPFYGTCKSRWQWCRQQLEKLDRDAREELSEPLQVACFAGNLEKFTNVKLNSVSDIFAETQPHGNTNAAHAVRLEFDDYFKRKAQTGADTKPLLVAIISDCAPDNPISLKEVIRAACSRLTKPNEVRLVFLQIGNDKRAKNLFLQLNRDAEKGRTRFDIVRCVDFSHVLKRGISGALIEAAREERGLAAAPSADPM